jgi:hypothetical protein
MKEIPLTKGKVALVDDEDYAALSQRKWCFRSGYAVRKTGGKIINMHHVLLPLNPGECTDHVDGNRLNNQKVNLRRCTHSQNMSNRRTFSGTGFKGVYFDKRSGSYYATIRPPFRPLKYLGRFKTAEDAARAFDSEARKIRGEFARLNFHLPGEQPARLTA